MTIKSKWQNIVAILVIVSTTLSFCGAKPEDEKIDHLLQLDGTPLKLMSNAYSGYLSVNEEKDLFYIFVESENDPTTDPILVE